MMDISKDKLVLIILLTEIFLLILSVLIYATFNVPIFSRINPSLEQSIIGIVSGLLLILINCISVFILPKYFKIFSGIREAYDLVSTIIKDLDPIAIVLISLISGSLEEIFFRGCLQPLIGIILTSFIFGLCHLANRKTIPYAIYTVFIGFYLGYLYIFTGNLWIPIFVHVLNNALSLPIMKWNAKNLARKN